MAPPKVEVCLTRVTNNFGQVQSQSSSYKAHRNEGKTQVNFISKLKNHSLLGPILSKSFQNSVLEEDERSFTSSKRQKLDQVKAKEP